MDVVRWLHGLGLGMYEAAFRQNDIDEAVLPNLTAEDLKELGVSTVGHRRKLLNAIAVLRSGAKAPSVYVPTESGDQINQEIRAERRQVTVMFSDLVGSTALSGRMDPEDLRGGHFGVPEVRRRDRGGIRRLRSEVHGRRGASLLRVSACA
jgi:class 3 adenylate cyclase